MTSPEQESNMRITNLEVELFYEKWASHLDSKYSVEFGEDLMTVIRAIGESIIDLMRPEKTDDAGY